MPDPTASKENEMTDFERRVAGQLSIEQRADGGGPQLVGYAAMFNSRSGDLGGFVEQIRQGAFSESVNSGADVRALWNHNDGQVLGRTAAGTLRLAEDNLGLRVEIDPPDTQAGRDALTSIERGDVNQMSFAFRVRPGGQDFAEDERGQVVRTLTDVELFEVSPVTFPAYEDTRVDVRAIDRAREQRAAANVDQGILFEDTGSRARMAALRAAVVTRERSGADWCEFRNLEAAADEPAEIVIYDTIGMFGTEPAEFIERVHGLRGRPLHVRINSPGGSVFDGAAIYNALRQHDSFVQVDIDGIAASMAGIVAMAGQRVRMNQSAFFMAHNASSCVMGDAKAMRHEADVLEKVTRSLAKTLAIRSGRDLAEVVAWMDAETWWDADDCRELGFCDEIMHEMGASIRHHNLAHFRNVPDRLLERRRRQWRTTNARRKLDLRERSI